MPNTSTRSTNSFGAWVALAIVGALVLAMALGCLSFFFLGVSSSSVTTFPAPVPTPASAPPTTPQPPPAPEAPEER